MTKDAAASHRRRRRGGGLHLPFETAPRTMLELLFGHMHLRLDLLFVCESCNFCRAHGTTLSFERGEAADEDVVRVVPVEHADPDVPGVRPELVPAPRQDLVPAEEPRAVLHVLPVAPQPRERCEKRANNGARRLRAESTRDIGAMA